MTKHININRGTIFLRKIKIYGKVQGIFFRASAKEQADKLGIVGFAQNQPDGSVYIEAEGKNDNLDEFVKWCRTGPSMAKVDNIEVTEGKVKSFPQFTVN